MQDDETGIYAQPDVTSGELPATAQQYAQIEWQEEFLGDVVFDKPPKFLVSNLAASFVMRKMLCVHKRRTNSAYVSARCIVHAHTTTSTTQLCGLLVLSSVAQTCMLCWDPLQALFPIKPANTAFAEF